MSDEQHAQALAEACAAAMMANDPCSQGLGITVETPQPGACDARMRIREDMLNGHDTCHGGLIFTLADTAFAFACNSYNQVAVAGSASIEFLRPVWLGDELTARARQQKQGKRQGLYDVSVVNQCGEKVAFFLGRSATIGGTHVDAEQLGVT